jgi:hypothetical protein
LSLSEVDGNAVVKLEFELISHERLLGSATEPQSELLLAFTAKDIYAASGQSNPQTLEKVMTLMSPLPDSPVQIIEPNGTHVLVSTALEGLSLLSVVVLEGGAIRVTKKAENRFLTMASSIAALRPDTFAVGTKMGEVTVVTTKHDSIVPIAHVTLDQYIGGISVPPSLTVTEELEFMVHGLLGGVFAFLRLPNKDAQKLGIDPSRQHQGERNPSLSRNWVHLLKKNATGENKIHDLTQLLQGGRDRTLSQSFLSLWNLLTEASHLDDDPF